MKTEAQLKAQWLRWYHSGGKSVINDIVGGVVILSFFGLLAVLTLPSFAPSESFTLRREAVESSMPPSPIDLWKTNPLPDDTFETFRKVQYGGVLVLCYSVIDPKTEVTRFSACTFTDKQSTKGDNK